MSCEPTFEFRFSNNINMHDSEKSKCSELMEEFVAEYIKETGCDCNGISIFPVARLGFSGAKVFYVNIYNTSSSEPEIKIAKFDNHVDIAKEAEKAEKFNQEIFGPYVGNIDLNNQGLLLYKEVPYGDEFLDIMLTNDDIRFCSKVLSNLYPTLIKSFYSEQTTETSNIITDYERYLNRKNNPIQKAKIVNNYFTEDNQKLFSFYTNLIDNPKNVNIVTVHGDLHARNILANNSGTHLIDFDWVHTGHVAKDFTLLESTVLYMILPDLILKKSGEHIEYNELSELHKQLYKTFEIGEYVEISSNTTKNISFLKAFEIIKVIRSYAIEVMTDTKSDDFKDSFEEYKYSLVLIGLSQISFQDANLEVLVNTTNYIIETINEA